MRIRLLLGALGALTIACTAQQDPAALPSASAGAAGKLVNREWRFVEAGGTAILAAEAASRTATLSLDSNERRAGGSTGCNSYFGSFALEGAALRFSNLGSTRVACEEPLMEQESRVFGALEATRGWEVRGDTLLLQGEGRVVARLVPRA